ncbi:hypothetical protein ACQEVG_33375 [Streptomyces sp. CA-135486]|uniref:hypothetical protein n=1 Tax=Streptomyces sp. CA-135486 TaxID=3240049 RepID=UPI003D90013A
MQRALSKRRSAHPEKGDLLNPEQRAALQKYIRAALQKYIRAGDARGPRATPKSVVRELAIDVLEHRGRA